jgi:soluble lytic murein transglycosylase-like protein
MAGYEVTLKPISRRACFVSFLAAVMVLLSSTARAQSPTTAADDDPVARAMKAIEASVQDRAKAAEAVLAASKFVNESTAARKRGDRDRATEALKEAEKLAAESEGFSRSALIEQLARLVASERAALNPANDQSARQLQSSKRLPVVVPRSVLARLEQYRDSFAQILHEEGVPVGLLGVALVESGFNPMALSPKGARGIWQFMPATARRYGLEIRPGDDHRTHPEHSTRAASRYLRDLYNQFGDWKLALAGYNAGEARVQRIIDRTGIRDFDEMARRGYLPAETRKYVPAVLAVWARLGGTNFLATPSARQRRQTRGGRHRVNEADSGGDLSAVRSKR